MSNSPPSPGPDLFFGGGECLTRFGVFVRGTKRFAPNSTRDSHASAVGRDGIIREFDPDLPRPEWLNEVNIDPTRNRLQFSESIGQTPWSVLRAFVVPADVSAPDLRPTAQKIVESTAAANSHFTAQVLDPEPPPDSDIAFSIFVKAAERPGCTLIVSDAAVANGTQVNFNAVDGSDVTFNTFGAGFALVDSGSIPIGGGWFRLFLTCTTTGEVINCRCSTNNGGTSVYDGDGVSGIYAWGGQTEVGLDVTAYQRTPRDTDRALPSLFLEDESTNAWTFSEELDNAIWLKFRASVDVDTATAPDGVASADQLTEDATAAATHFLNRLLPTLTAGEPQSVSGFCLAGARSKAAVTLRFGGDAFNALFDFESGTIGEIVTSGLATGVTALISSELPGGWFRWELSGIINPTVTGGANFDFNLADDDGNVTYDGDGVSGMHLWGLQFEVDAPVGSSYIATAGVTVTRAVDSFDAAFRHPPQAMTVYHKFIESGTLLQETNSRLFQIGRSGSGADSRFLVRHSGSSYVLQYGDGSVLTNATVPLPPAPGDLVEHVLQLAEDGGIIAAAALNGGDVEIANPVAGAPLPLQWTGGRMFVNGADFVGATGFTRTLALKAHRGLRTLDFMRSL